MRPKQTFPDLDVTTLRPYVPALRMAERAIRERREELADRFEPTSLEVWDEAQEEIRELREMVDAVEGGA